MNRLLDWFKIVIKKQKELKRWQRIVTALAAIITFVTTYALILPAITVEKDSTEIVGGMYLEKTADRDDLLEENALEPVGVSIAADMENAVTFAYSDDDISATAVFSTDEEIPEGAELVVNPVDPESEDYADLSARAADLLDKEFIYDVTTCSFYDFALVCDNVDVTPETGLADIQIIFRNNTVEHVNDVVYAGRFAKPAEATDGFVAMAAADENAADELVSVNIDESSVIELADGIIMTLSLKGNDLARSDSIVGILAGNVDGEIKAAAAEVDAEIPDGDGSLEEELKNLTVSGSDYTVTLTYDETSGIPKGAVLTASEIAKDSKEYQTYLKETKKAMGLTEEETLPRFAARFFDIKIMVGDKEFTPESGVSVEITYAEPLAEKIDAEVSAVHFADEKAEAEVIEANASEIQDDGQATVEFTAESFSVYGVIYTVDFHWEVDGKTYDFSIPGGGFVTLRQLVEVLGIANSDAYYGNASDDAKNGEDFNAEDDENSVEKLSGKSNESIYIDVEISEETRKFVADVERVEFSSPDLAWVGKVNENSTVGGLKDANGLQCEYSADLTNDQISDINAQTVESGDWAVINMQPFMSEESLTITMKNGDQFVVKVTDAQEVTDASSTSIDVSKSYLICYELNGTYYILKNDGSVDSTRHPDFDGDPDPQHDFEHINSGDCWTFNYVFEEMDVEETLTYVYYLIRPIDNKTKTIALNAEGEPLVQRSNNNVAVVPAEGGGFKLIGYNNIRLDFDTDSGQFIATEFPDNEQDDGITVHIWEMNSLPTYSYKAYSADELRGTVEISNGTPKTENVLNDENEVIQVIHYYEAESNSEKMNTGTITAIPDDHPDGDGDNKWLFDHWTQDGLPLDRTQYPETINAETLPIPFNGSTLVAYFKQNPDYDVPPGEKEPSHFDDLEEWIESLETNPVPIDKEETSKSSEVYDYENRIYRVDIASKSNFRTFNGNVDMAFCMDVSNSMKFPSALTETTTSNYNNGNVNIPIYQINWWGNQEWLDTSRGYDDPYYLIADEANTATVFKIYYKGGEWRAIDASRPNDSNSSQWFRIGNNFRTNWTADQYDNTNNKNHPFNTGDNDYTTYTIYDHATDEDGIKRNRFYYLNQALSSATTDLTTIKDILAVAGDDSPNVRVAYNTFNANLGSQRQDFQTVRPLEGIDLSYSANGGTRPDQAFIDAQTFDWQGDDKYIILITDGAPQGRRDDDAQNGVDNNDFDSISSYVESQASILKQYAGVKFITIGLSLDKVPHGKQLLYDLADNDKNGEKMFFLAEDASDLPNILRQVVKTIMDEAIVMADVTDSVGEAFYAVDKTTGLPLVDGDTIDIEGQLTTDPARVAGTVQIVDGVTTIKWKNQAVDSRIGWHGTVYVKAKEELLGGNALQTNAGAQIEATKYRMGAKEYDFNQSLFNPDYPDDPEGKLKSLQVGLDSPRVNVNELSFPELDSEWTVYLGTEVDPKMQLKKMYEEILVEKVVNEDGSLHYPIAPNNIADNRESEVVGDAATFSMSDVILECIKATAGTSDDLAALYMQGDELNWETFLPAILSTNGLKVPYHLYGTEGEDSSITIKLTKQILEDEEDDLVNHSPHNTTVLNDGDTPAEKYTFTIRYDPDYDHVLPAGQGGKPNGNHNYNFGTGTNGTMYQGHAAGRETSTTNHVINVYNVPLDVYKTDENNQPLADATFKLYKEDAENGVAVTGMDSTKKYTEVAAATSGTDGMARLKHNGEDFNLVLGETYYLIENSAPANYMKVNTVWAVEVQTEIGRFTDLDGETIYSESDPDWVSIPPVTVGNGVTDDMYPFNWDQGARIVLNGKIPVAVIAKGETDGSTATITDGSFVSHERAISFRHTVQNLAEGDVGISVNKTWENVEQKPDSITVKLYRVSEKDHKWGNGVVVPCTCTEEGVEEYTCSQCGEKDTHIIGDASNHVPGTPHVENEVEPTCTTAGGYDTVVRCKVCNAIISSEHTDIPANDHNWVTQEVETTDTDYCYDTVDICSLCGTINEDSRVHHDHDWGEWQVAVPAEINITGSKTHICQHDSTHRETEPIDPLPATVNIYFRYTRGGCGGPGFICQRSGSGVGDMTITWNWDGYTSPENVNIGVEGTSTYTTSSSGNYNGAQQTLTIHNITTNLTIYVTFSNSGSPGTNDDLIGQPTFSGIPIRSVSLNSRRNVLFAGKRSASLDLMNTELVRGGKNTSTITAESLNTYLNSLKTKEEASCKDNEEHTYKEYVGEYTISGDDWTLPISDLAKYNEYGKEYTYYVVEDPILEGYEVTYTGQDNGLHDEGEVTINNKLTIGSLKITKNVSIPAGLSSSLADGTYTFEIWNADNTSQITKKVDNTDIGILQITVTDGVASPAELTIPNLTAGNYIVKETESTNSATMIDTSVSGYDSALGGIVVTVTAGDTLVPTAAFTNKYETTSATVRKVWDDNNNPNRPSNLTVQLVADGELTSHTVTLSDSNHWEDTISNLPKYRDGVEIDYHWLEGEMPDGYFLTDVTKNGIITTLTNTLSQYDLQTSYTGIKSWNDEGDKYSTRPHELTVTLYADNDALSVEPVWNYDYATNQWSYTFENLPVFNENGALIHYTAAETVPEGYNKTGETQTPTTGQVGSVEYEDGHERVTNNKITWELGSLIDLSFVAVKPASGGDVVVWSHRIPVSSEKTTITDAIKAGALPDCQNRNIVFYSGTGDVNTPYGNVQVTYDQANLAVILDFGTTDVWQQFIVGQFNQNDSSSYNTGTTAFTNTLETTELNGTKIWSIEGEEIPANPILTLTRTVTTTEGEGSEAVITISEPEVVKVMQGGTLVNLQPEWSGTGKNKSFSYSGLPKYNSQGKEYTYSVAEASFTIGSGENAVTYTVVKSANDTYTVTADKPGATVYTVTQTGNNITNSLVEASIEIIKVEKGHKDSDHTLSGAKFRLTRVNEDNDNNYAGEGAYQSDIQTVDAETGKTKFTGLRPGRYKLEEIDSPSGYIMVESPWFFTIDNTGTAAIQANYSYHLVSDVLGVDNTFWVENPPGASLPSTGGAGTLIFYALGLLFVLGAASVLIHRRRLSRSIV